VLLDDDGGYDPDREVGRNRLKLTPLPDGSVTLTGELVGEQALVVRQCVEAHADRLFHRLSGQAKACPELAVPTRATLLALALAELVLRGSTVDLEHSDGPATDVTLIIEATKPHNTDTDTDTDTDSNSDSDTDSNPHANTNSHASPTVECFICHAGYDDEG